MANMKLMREDSKRIIEQDSKRPRLTVEEAIQQFKDLHSSPEPTPEKPANNKETS